MTIDVRNLVTLSTRSVPALALSVALGLGISTSAGADEADAKRLLKGMSDLSLIHISEPTRPY